MNLPPSPVPILLRKSCRAILPLGLLACALLLTPFARAQSSAADGQAGPDVLAPIYGIAWDRDTQPDLADFSAWALAQVKSLNADAATAGTDDSTLSESVRLAERRRVVVAALMNAAPARALSISVPAGIRAKLPAEVVDRLETPFSAVGDYLVDPGSGRREITINGRTYTAHVYGRRVALASRRNVFLHGILLGGEAVLDENVLRVLPAGEAAIETRTPRDFSTAAVTDRSVLVDGGGVLYRFASAGQVGQAEDDLRAFESQPTTSTPGVDENTVLENSASAPTRHAPVKQFASNDFFANAQLLTGTSGSVGGTNIGATKELGEPDHAGDSGGASVWYVYTPPTNGTAVFYIYNNIDTYGYAFDSLLAVYTGTIVSALTEVASDDDYGGSLASRVSFQAQAGVTYHIAVDGFGGDEGTFDLGYYLQSGADAPTITSSSTASAQTGTYFFYQITATNNPTSFGATGLPDGLSIDPTTGIISGIPTTAGDYSVVLTAANSDGTASGYVILEISDEPVHPAFFDGEVALPQNPGVYYLHLVGGNVFGYYSYLTDPNYIYHFDLGYEYIFDAADGENGIYMYDFASNTFFYTSPYYPFPYLFDFALQTTLYYYPDPTHQARFNTNGIRYFYDFATDTIISK